MSIRASRLTIPPQQTQNSFAEAVRFTKIVALIVLLVLIYLLDHFAHPDEGSGAAQANYFIAHGGGWSSRPVVLAIQPLMAKIGLNLYQNQNQRITSILLQ